MRPDVQGSVDDVDLDVVEYVVIVLPDEAAAEIVLETAHELAEQGLVRILDVASIVRDARRAIHFSHPSGTGVHRGLLTDGDLRLVADVVPDDSIALVVVAEDSWARPLAQAARRVGGRFAGGERIPADRLVLALGGPPTPGGDPR
jgi:hypothetical protein